MILVDIYVPSVDRVYDFQVDESYSVAVIVEEVCEMIQQREQMNGFLAEEAAVLLDEKTQRMLPLDQTMEECRITDGNRLILV